MPSEEGREAPAPIDPDRGYHVRMSPREATLVILAVRKLCQELSGQPIPPQMAALAQAAPDLIAKMDHIQRGKRNK